MHIASAEQLFCCEHQILVGEHQSVGVHQLLISCSECIFDAAQTLVNFEEP